MLIISEPNIKKASKSGWLTDIPRSVAIKVVGDSVRVGRFESNDTGFVWAQVNDITFYSCYISPNSEIDEFESYLNRLQRSINGSSTDGIVVAGDFNAKSSVWGNKADDRRGKILLDWMASNNLIIQNRGDEPTFRRSSSASIIDVTLTSEKLSGKIDNWKVLEEESLSDHMLIYYELVDIAPKKAEKNVQKNQGWRITKTENFVKHFADGMAARNKSCRQITAEDLVSECTTACNKSFAKKRSSSRQPAYWWNHDIAKLRTLCLKQKRTLVRGNRSTKLGGTEKEANYNNYKVSKRTLKIAIQNSKKAAWNKIRDELDADIWGLGYKIVMKHTKLYPQIKLHDARQLEIAKDLFPQAKHNPNREFLDYTPERTFAPLNISELETATSSIKGKKAAGPDGIPPEIVKAAAHAEPDMILAVCNNLLEQGVFPSMWKRAQLVLIQKGSSSKYRPICLLDIFGKLFERLIANRLSEEVEEKMCNHQYGFRKGRSTIDAMMNILNVIDSIKSKAPNNREFCIMATLDIRNAFNSAPWEGILAELRKMRVSNYLCRVLANYLLNRTILVGNGLRLEMECGVPQGSILGPLLWNIFYDSVLRTPMPAGIILLGFADDTAIVCKSKSKTELINNTNWALQAVSKAIEEKGLELATEKTEAVILYGGRRLKTVKLQVGNCEIETKAQLTYLGVAFEYNCDMKQHVVACTTKAEKAVLALSRLMPNIGGPIGRNRRILSNVAQSILLYAAPAWSRALKWRKYQTLVSNVQRRMALRICSGFRTMSTDAALVLAGIPPIDIEINLRCQRYLGVPSENNEDTLSIWGRRWMTPNGKAEWTKRLIPELERWINRRHGEVDFYLSQLLSGHGWFNGYRKRFHLNDSDLCSKCNVPEDANHVFFNCLKWKRHIELATAGTGVILDATSCVEFMLESQQNWSAVATLTRLIVEERRKEQDS